MSELLLGVSPHSGMCALMTELSDACGGRKEVRMMCSNPHAHPELRHRERTVLVVELLNLLCGILIYRTTCIYFYYSAGLSFMINKMKNKLVYTIHRIEM